MYYSYMYGLQAPTNKEMLWILKDAVASSVAIRNIQGQKLSFVDQNVRITKV